ncbi:aldo/keto reductase [Cytophagaceae bacterium ABcell3]|nr:aldo/keto reductase [Cytophagaceae bacterium ABcell3]
MQYSTLGNSDIQVSEISFGCMSLGNDGRLNADLLHQALDLGVNYFDTADVYQQGMNETFVGQAFKGVRDKLVLSSKAGNQVRPDGKGFDWNPSKAHILKAAEDSLKRLQTDYIDVYMLHGGTIDDPMDETMEAFELLKAQGKIRAWGISSIRPNVIREYVRKADIACVMMQYSLLDRRPEEACLELLKNNNISVLARGALAKGLLAGKPEQPYLGYSETEVKKVAEKIKNIASHDCHPSGVALRFALHHPAVATAVVGIRTSEQLIEAVGAANCSVSEQDMITLKSVLDPNFYAQHR